jgi:hypothetical protein
VPPCVWVLRLQGLHVLAGRVCGAVWWGAHGATVQHIVGRGARNTRHTSAAVKHTAGVDCAANQGASAHGSQRAARDAQWAHLMPWPQCVRVGPLARPARALRQRATRLTHAAGRLGLLAPVVAPTPVAAAHGCAHVAVNAHVVRQRVVARLPRDLYVENESGHRPRVKCGATGRNAAINMIGSAHCDVETVMLTFIASGGAWRRAVER